MTIINPDKTELFWFIPSPFVQIDYDGLIKYVHQTLAPYTNKVTYADCLVDMRTVGVHQIVFSNTRNHKEADPNALAISKTGSWRIQDGLTTSPIWLFCDNIMKGYSGDRLYQRFVRVICHEIAHTVGLEHNTLNPNDLMYPVFSDRPWTMDRITKRIIQMYFNTKVDA